MHFSILVALSLGLLAVALPLSNPSKMLKFHTPQLLADRLPAEALDARVASPGMSGRRRLT
jgi:hypothetical protein